MNHDPSRRGELRDMREPVLDPDCQSELVRLIGQARVLELLNRLAEDLHAKLCSADPDALRADAHSIVSTAGLLGFAALSATARRLEHAIDGGEDFGALLCQLLEARSAAMSAIADASNLVAITCDFKSAR